MKLEQFLELQQGTSDAAAQAIDSLRLGLELVGIDADCREFVLQQLMTVLAESRAMAPATVPPQFAAEGQRLVDDYCDRMWRLIVALVHAYVEVWQARARSKD